jgi:hypothetical protein
MYPVRPGPYHKPFPSAEHRQNDEVGEGNRTRSEAAIKGLNRAQLAILSRVSLWWASH